MEPPTQPGWTHRNRSRPPVPAEDFASPPPPPHHPPPSIVRLRPRRSRPPRRPQQHRQWSACRRSAVSDVSASTARYATRRLMIRTPAQHYGRSTESNISWFFDYAATRKPDEPERVKLSTFLQRETDYCSPPYAQPENVDPRSQHIKRTQRTEKPAAKCDVSGTTGHHIDKFQKYLNRDTASRRKTAKAQSTGARHTLVRASNVTSTAASTLIHTGCCIIRSPKKETKLSHAHGRRAPL